jgi:hypothetical protein
MAEPQGITAELYRAIVTIVEDIARVVLPGYLKQRYGVTVERLERRIFSVDGQRFDVDLYAEVAAYQPTMEATAPRRRRRTKRV